MTHALRLAPVRRVADSTSVIMCYHGLGDSSIRDDPWFLQIPVERFRTHVELLLAAGFEFLTVADFVARCDGGPPPPGLAALSFDDGMEDNHSVLLPLLQEYGIPATVYVTTGLIGKPNPWMSPASGARMMTEAELRALAAAGIELGAHTVTHPDLSELDRETCLREMVESRETLERLTGAPVTTFAYPFCTYGPDAVAAATEAGFAAAVTCRARGDWSRYHMKRAAIRRDDSFLRFVLKLSDRYDPLLDSVPGRIVRWTTRGARRRLRELNAGT